MLEWINAEIELNGNYVKGKKRFYNNILKGDKMLSLLFVLFESAWRRCFGSNGWDIPVLKIRAIQHIIGFIITSLALWICDYNWFQIVACSSVLQFLYWAKGHGMCFDYGHGEVDLNRYERMLSWRLIRKYIPEKYWYEYSADFILMTTRYTLPAVLMSVILLKPHLCLLGVIVAGVYAFFWALYDVGLTKKPTEISEWIAGFITGFLLVV